MIGVADSGRVAQLGEHLLCKQSNSQAKSLPRLRLGESNVPLAAPILLQNLKPTTRLRVWATIMSPSESPIQTARGNALPLAGVLPAFTAELQQLLVKQGEPELAAQVPSLRILERCDCGDDFCATFYTRPKPNGSFGPGHRNVRLFPDEGSLLVLDIVDGEIACIELLDRSDIREMLLVLVP